MWVWSLGREDPLEEEMAAHSSILAWRTPWTEELGGLLPMGLQRVRHGWATEHIVHLSWYSTHPTGFSMLTMGATQPPFNSRTFLPLQKETLNRSSHPLPPQPLATPHWCYRSTCSGQFILTYMKSYNVSPFVSGIFHLAYFWASSLHFFLRLDNTPS